MSKEGKPSFWRRAAGQPEPVSKATPLALPAPGAVNAAPSPDPLADEIERLIDELREATRTAGVGRDDPMMPLLKTFASMIRYIGNRTSANDYTVTEASQRIVDALLLAKNTAHAETVRFENSIAAAETDIIARVGSAIASSADKALARRVRVFDRNTALAAALALFVIAGGCLGGGYWWGSSNAYAHIHQTEAGLRAAFSEGAADASIWLDLMNWNPIQSALVQCPAGQAHMQHGRKACDVPLWIEPPVPTVPQVSGQNQAEPLPPGTEPFAPLQTVQAGRDPANPPADPPRKTRERNKARP